ncbi:endonuclease domain-containing protein [Caulobacter sp. 602-1]|uniref:endonuclease domain-containing protein n=1 Tax=Caulobacter sp. 602-1 TaxID=2492472 RepID=UPI001F462EB3|nr:endonuclease domain-containing protein [Caulobacter sp. 602-1]
MRAPLERRLTAQRFRRELTLPEVLLWQALKGRQLEGLLFRRQHPVGPYILDFYCEALKLAIEVDGEQHALDDHPKHDERRDAWFAMRGVDTLRIPARDILQAPENAARAILEHVRARPLRPSGPPPPQCGGGSEVPASGS